MKCQQCVDNNETSTVMPTESFSTCAYYSPGYYNEDGLWVRLPDRNTTTNSYLCSNGHVFNISIRYSDETGKREVVK